MSQTTHPLKDLLGEVRLWARVVLVVHAVAWVFAIVLAAGLLLCLLDMALRTDDPLVRLLCCGLWWVGLVAAVYRFLYPAIAVRLSDVQLAQRVQQHWPELGDELTSAVEFIEQAEDDVLAGSPDLRRTVIADAAARVDPCRPLDIVDFRRPLVGLLLGAGLAGLVITAFCIAPASASLATKRLLLPLGADSWPRTHRLAFIETPRQLASGDDFQVELIDENGELPDLVEILFRPIDDEGGETERQPMEYDFARNRMVYRLRNVTQSFEYRAVGGDDQTLPWIRLDVIQPPRLDSLEIKLHPPAYTGWPSETSDRHIRALAGTRAEVRATATKPLHGAAVVIDTSEGRSELPASLAEDAKTFTIPADENDPWLIQESGVYGFQLVDRQRFEQAGRSRWELRAIADRPPTISLERPGPNTYVTADAVVRLKALVKDDLLIRSIDLAYRRSTNGKGADDDKEAAETKSLYRGPPQAPPVKRSPLSTGGPSGDSLSIDRQWDLSELKGVQPGDTIEFFLTAGDYKPQDNKCTVRRLIVISADELAERIAQRQTFILSQLAQALAAQRDARSQTKALSIQLEEVGNLNPQDINHLQSAELNQRQVEQLLVDDRDGIGAQIEDLLADLVSNRVDSPDIQRRMEALLGEIRRIGSEHLPIIQQQLVLGIKTSQARLPAGEGPRSKEIKQRLDLAGSHQDQVIDSLERLRSQLAKWDSYRRFAREISQLRRKQVALAGDTAERHLTILGRDFRQLNTSDRARLRQLAERQFELARELERILGRMEQMQLELADADPLASETIGDAVDIARRLAIAEEMRRAGRDIETNRLGQTAQTHESIDQSLEEMLDILAGRRAHELHRLIRQLEKSRAELDDTLEQTKGLVKKLRAAEDDHNTGRLPPEEKRRQLERLLAEQKRLKERVDRLARQLQRLQAQRAGQTVSQAAQKLGGACRAQEGGSQKSALEQTQDAQKDLEEANQQLQQQMQQLEQDLLQEQFAKLEQQVEMLRDQQQAMLDETQRLRQLELAQERLTRGQAESVRDLAREQRALADEALAFAESFSEAPVFHAVLEGAADDMNRSAARLARRLLADTTQRIQQEAIERLNNLLEALKPDESEDNGDEGGAGQGANGGGQGRVTSLVELKLLKMMQEDLYRRTVALHETRQRRGEDWTDELVAELNDLAEEQGRLAQLLLDMSETIDEAPEDNPENLPDIRDDDPLELDPDLDEELKKSLPGTVPEDNRKIPE
jgi:hypothetical protein